MDDVLDYGPLCELAVLGSERFGLLVESYAASAEKQLVLVGDGLAEDDCDAARLGAHTLRGTSLIFGAHRVVACASEREHAAIARRVADCNDHYQALRAAVDAAVAQLRTVAIEKLGS